MMTENIGSFISKKFSQYYENARPSIPDIKSREFGMGDYEKKIAFRHLFFANEQELHSRLRKDSPLYISTSAAYYEFPDARPMTKKNWLGADLIFDLDAPDDELAPFITDTSLEDVKEKVTNLIEEFLIPDFGFSHSDMQVNFSGSRGYHVRVYSKAVRQLKRPERREIVDYIELNGVSVDWDILDPKKASKNTNLDKLGMRLFWQEPVENNPNLKKLIGPTPNDGGHKGRFARKILDIIKDREKAVRLTPKFKADETRMRMIEGIKKGDWSRVQIPNAVQKFKDLFYSTKVEVSSHVDADANVTIDTAKILRLPDSIHGGSSLIAKTVDFSGLDRFDPLKHASPFSDSKTMEIQADSDIPSLRFGSEEHNPIKKDEKKELPEAFAMYLICKKRARPLNP